MNSLGTDVNCSLLRESENPKTKRKKYFLIVIAIGFIILATISILFYLEKISNHSNFEFKWDDCGQTWYKPSIDVSKFEYANRHKRIIGGQDSVKNSWPFLVSIRLTANKSYHVCGGNLISDIHILTAAHCLWLLFKPLNYNLSLVLNMVEVHVGIHDYDTDPLQLTEENIYKIDIFNWHPEFNQINFSLFNDIAIIKLKRKVKINRPEVNLVCLPFEKNLMKPSLKYDDWVVAIGWGTYSENYDHSSHFKNSLQQAIFRVQNHNSLYCNTGMIGDQWDKEKTICAYDETQTPKSTCFGDSGGPVLAYRNHKWYLFGIISFGNDVSNSTMRKCNGSQPFYFMNVSAYSEWITETLKYL